MRGGGALVSVSIFGSLRTQNPLHKMVPVCWLHLHGSYLTDRL